MIDKASFHTFCKRLENNDLFKDSFWALSGSALGKGLSLLAGIAVARFLGKEVYGEYGTIRITLNYIAIVSTFGLGYSATKYIAQYINNNSPKLKSLVRQTLKITFIFSIILTIFQILFAKQIANFIHAPHLYKILQYFAVLIVVNAVNTTQIAILAGFKLFKDNAKINAISGIVTFVSSAIFTYIWGIVGALSALLIAFLTQVALNNIVINKALAHYDDIDEQFTNAETRQMLKFSLPIALQDSLFTITHWLTTYLLIYYANYGEVGMSSAAHMWQSVVIFIPAMLKNVMFSHMASTNDKTCLVKKFLLVNLFSSLIPTLVIIALSSIIVSFYGDNYVGLQAILIICVCSSVLICLGEVYAYELIILNSPWRVFLARVIRDALIFMVGFVVLSKIQANQALYLALISAIMHAIYLMLIRLLYKSLLKINI